MGRFNDYQGMLEDFRLKVFKAVAEKGNFTRAAKALGISQPAVSQNISELEKAVGTKLFERSALRVSLTPQGRLILHFAEDILRRYSDIEAVFGISRATSGDIQGVERTVNLAIYADRTAGEYIIPEIIEVLQTANPQLHIELADNKESADIRVTSTLYRKSGSMVFTFDVAPSGHPLTSAILSLINRN